MKIFKQHDPESCCVLPSARIVKSYKLACENKCKDINDSCCFFDCLYETTGMYVDGRFHAKKAQEAYENGFNESMSDESEMFKPVLSKSLEKCENLSKLFIFGKRLSNYLFLPLI